MTFWASGLISVKVYNTLKVRVACEIIQFGILFLRFYKYLPKDFIIHAKIMILFVQDRFLIYFVSTFLYSFLVN